MRDFNVFCNNVNTFYVFHQELLRSSNKLPPQIILSIGASPKKLWTSHSVPISTNIRLMKALVWPVATYGCESWTLRKNETAFLDAFEMKGLRKILSVSWTAIKQMSGF